MKDQLFISYARDDLEFARWVHGQLAEAGLAAWFDVVDLPPSAPWLGGVERAIEAAGAFALVVSRSSVGSEQCMAELRHAHLHRKAIYLIVPRRLELRAPPGDLPGALVVPLHASVDLEEVLADLAAAT